MPVAKNNFGVINHYINYNGKEIHAISLFDDLYFNIDDLCFMLNYRYDKIQKDIENNIIDKIDIYIYHCIIKSNQIKSNQIIKYLSKKETRLLINNSVISKNNKYNLLKKLINYNFYLL